MLEITDCRHMEHDTAQLTLLHALQPAQMSFFEGVQENAGAISALPLPDDFTGCACPPDGAAEATAWSIQYVATVATSL